MRLVDADALEDQIGISDKDIYFKEVLSDAPTVESMPVVYAHWIEKTTPWNMGCFKYYVCSNCGAKKADSYEDNGNQYCDVCAAKMKGAN